MTAGFVYRSTKTYNHSIGLACCFRQWRATDSHCQYLHGYALKVKLMFASPTLDNRNWVVNFGGLKPVKAWLESQFDHKTVVAEDDPQMSVFLQMEAEGLIQLVVVKATGCEKFAEMIFDWVSDWLKLNIRPTNPGVWLEAVEVAEHDGNSAIVSRIV